MSEKIRVLSELSLNANMSFERNLSGFPPNPSPRTIAVVAGTPYIYSELIDGSGFFTWMPITPGTIQASYLHTQGVPSTTWTVNHGFNTDNFAYFVYDTNHSMVYAGMTIVNENTCTINLSSAMAGTVVLFSLQFMNTVALTVSEELVLGLTTTVSIKESGGKLTVNNAPVALESDVSAAVATLTAGVADVVSGKSNLNGSSSTNFAASTLTVGDIMPAVPGVSKIGDATHKFGAVFTEELYLDANTLYIDGVAVIGSNAETINITADMDQGIRIATTGTGQTILNSAAATSIKTTGMNADVLIQSEGVGSTTRLTSATQVTLTAPTVSIVGDGTVSGSLTVAGGLIVAGTTTTVNTTNLAVKDSVMTLNKGEAGSGVSTRYSGLDIDRGDLSRQRIVWDETAGLWKVGATNEEVAIATQPFVTAAVAAGVPTSSNIALALGYTPANADFSNVGTLPPSIVEQLRGADGAPGVAAVGSAGTGFILNNNVIGTSYTIPVGSNATSCGPLTMTGGAVITVSGGSRWVVL